MGKIQIRLRLPSVRSPRLFSWMRLSILGYNLRKQDNHLPFLVFLPSKVERGMRSFHLVASITLLLTHGIIS